MVAIIAHIWYTQNISACAFARYGLQNLNCTFLPFFTLGPQFRQGEVVFCNSLVLYDIHGNELHQTDLITGASHDVNPSSLNFVVCAYTWRGFMYFSIGQDFTLINEKYVNHSHSKLAALTFGEFTSLKKDVVHSHEWLMHGISDVNRPMSHSRVGDVNPFHEWLKGFSLILHLFLSDCQNTIVISFRTRCKEMTIAFWQRTIYIKYYRFVVDLIRDIAAQ